MNLSNLTHDDGLCSQYEWLSPYFNVCKYSVLDMTLIVLGTVFWCIAYYAIIRKAFKQGFVEMPMMVAAANIAWEFVWSFTKYHTDMGLMFHWGFRIWFFMDVLIFYNVFRHGHKQMTLDLLKKHFKPLFVGITIAWILALYYFAQAHLDTAIAANSAYVITVLMSSLYITLFLSQNKPSLFSFTAAWTKGVGSGFMSVFVFMHYSNFRYIQLLAAVVTILDIAYVYIFYKRLKQSRQAQVAAAA